ncbi:BNR-4 repeat-containing protein [Vibrio maritimus]|uniref:BNR-4 repeat-containing protein n=1 Tax=Vibrio maritimus TaxID=990268 RepID=UPI0037370798
MKNYISNNVSFRQNNVASIRTPGYGRGLRKLSAIALSIGALCVHSNVIAAGKTGEFVEYFADNGFSTPVAVVNSPAGVHANGVTYISYQGDETDPYVVSYNHETKEWTGPYKAGVSELGKDKASARDSHGKPTMVLDDLGYIHIFYGGHGGSDKFGENTLGNTNRGMNKHAVSTKPYDISSFEDLDNISPFGNYNQAIKMDNGDIYLFYRHGAHRSDWVYQKSTDNGRTFEEPVSFLTVSPREDIDAHDSWYIWVTRGEGDELIISYDYHVCWNTTSKQFKARGHTAERNSLFYMVYDTKNNTWKNVKGEVLTAPVDRDQSLAKTLVAQTPNGHWTFNGSVHLDNNGLPNVTINSGEDQGKRTWGGPKQTLHYRWDGEKWLGGNPVNPIAQKKKLDTRGDFFLNSDGELTYALGYRQGNHGYVGYFSSDDGGKSFKQTHELLKVDKSAFAMSPIITNAHPEARFIAAQKVPGEKTWRKMFLIGDNGAVERLKSEAER